MLTSVADACEILRAEIAQFTGEKKIAYIQFRRDLHNQRLARAEGLLELYPAVFNQSVRDRFSGILALSRDLRESQERLSAALDSDLEEELNAVGRNYLASSAAKGLALSAPAFFARLHEGRSFVSETGLTKAGFTLLKYVARCTTKTSPFSFFTPVAYGHLTGSHGVGVHDGYAPSVVSHASLDCARFLNPLGSPTLHDSPRHYRWNSSLQFVGGRFLWMVENGRSDSIRSMAPETAGDFCHALLTASTASQREKEVLLGALSGDQKEQLLSAFLLLKNTSDSKAKEDIKRYLSLGDGLEELLPNMSRAALDECRYQLRVVRETETAERITALKKLACLLGQENPQEVGADDSVELNYHRQKYVVREDVTAVESWSLPEDSTSKQVGQLAAAQEVFLDLSGASKCLTILGRLFREWFPGETEISFIVFAERLFRELRETPENLAGNIGLESVILRQFEARFSEVLTPLIQRVQANTRIRSSSTHIHLELCEPKPGERGKFEANSLGSAVLQPIKLNGASAWVVNAMGTGCGRAYGRWLNYNKDFSQSVIAWLDSIRSPETIDACVSTTVSYHLDHHPALANNRIEIPNLHSHEGEGVSITLADCVLRLQEGRELWLVQKSTGARVHVNYQSIIKHSLRSWITQLLACFSRPGSTFDVGTIRAFVDTHSEKSGSGQESAIKFKRRIVLGDSFVVRRAHWYVPFAQLPLVPRNAKSSDALHVLDEWRQINGIPDQTYVRSIVPEAERKVDSFKPQFIDWCDPIWVLYFHRLILKRPKAIIIEEALPDKAMCDQGRCAEYILHWAGAAFGR